MVLGLPRCGPAALQFGMLDTCCHPGCMAAGDMEAEVGRGGWGGREGKVRTGREPVGVEPAVFRTLVLNGALWLAVQRTKPIRSVLDLTDSF